LHQVGDLFELNVKLWCQKVKRPVLTSQKKNELPPLHTRGAMSLFIVTIT